MSAFVDEAQLNLRGGDGGAGCVSMRREGPVAMGGPNGGDGGKGGDVWLVANHNVASLVAFKDYPHRKAGNGVHGQGKDMHGKRGEDLIITVPEGTVVKDLYTGEVLADLVGHGDRWMAVAGGRGGRGNAKFLSNSRRAPMFAEQGEELLRGRSLVITGVVELPPGACHEAGRMVECSIAIGAEREVGRHDAIRPFSAVR